VVNADFVGTICGLLQMGIPALSSYLAKIIYQCCAESMLNSSASYSCFSSFASFSFFILVFLSIAFLSSHFFDQFFSSFQLLQRMECVVASRAAPWRCWPCNWTQMMWYDSESVSFRDC
jgi:hypothetical protein